MITDLPYTLTVDGEEKAINCDFRDIITICNAFNDPEVPQSEKTVIMLHNLYVDDYKEFHDINEAIKQAVWFIDWGKEYETKENTPRLMDWERDFNMIISAADKSVKTVESCLELPFMHWWTFLSKFSERGECLLSTVMTIREKLAKHKRLDKFEKEILRENRDIIILKNKENEELENELWG